MDDVETPQRGNSGVEGGRVDAHEQIDVAFRQRTRDRCGPHVVPLRLGQELEHPLAVFSKADLAAARISGSGGIRTTPIAV